MEISNWLPADFVHQTARTGGEAFNEAFRGTQFLLVKLDGARPRLVTGLAATSTLEPLTLDLDPDELRTDFMSTFLSDDFDTAIEVDRSIDITADHIVKRLGEKRCFVVALKPRPGRGTADAMSLGRSPGNDIVFRDPSVSQHHAWFVRDEEGALRLCDLGSKNGTRINGKMVRNRDVPVVSGDSLTFGRVEAMVCDSGVLWRVLRTSLPPRA